MAYSFITKGGLSSIQNYLTARTRNGLRRAMLRNNLRLKKVVAYSTPQYIKENGPDEPGVWVVWYVDEDLDMIDQAGAENGE